VHFWNQVRVSAVLLIYANNTPEDSINFTSSIPTGVKLSALSLNEQNKSPNSKQILSGFDQFNRKLDKKYTFSGLTDENG
jgi:hypothetical protein